MQSDIRVLEVEPYFRYERARTPLKFGGVVMDRIEYCHVRALVENRAGERAEGWGAIFLSDVWAWPSPHVSHELREMAMREVVVQWCRRVAEGNEFAHPIEHFWRIESELVPLAKRVCQELAIAEPMPRMAAIVCASPLDAALHDAFGLAAGIDTYAGYGSEHISSDLGTWLGPEFTGRYVNEFLTPLPRRLDAFHLVGGLDKLTEVEVTPEDPQDSLPVSLASWVRYEGLTCLKVKLRGNDLPWDLERLMAVAAVAREEHARLGIEDLWITVDTNEMCDHPAYMVEYLEQLRERDPRTFEAILYCEQPCERDLRRRRLDVRELAAIKPVIVDEALASLEDLYLALELGYSGAALKTCKCQSAELVMAAYLTENKLPFAVQDLTNPGIALLQSAGLAGRLGTIRGIESNSRQFYPATSAPERRVHPGIFKLERGQMDLSSLAGPGLGYRWQEIGRDMLSDA